MKILDGERIVSNNVGNSYKLSIDKLNIQVKKYLKNYLSFKIYNLFLSEYLQVTNQLLNISNLKNNGNIILCRFIRNPVIIFL